MRLAAILTAALAAGCGTGSPRAILPARDPAADEAREVLRAADEFAAAARAGNWDAAAAAGDVPFLLGDWTEPRRVDDRGALAAQLKQAADGFGGSGAVGAKAVLATPVRADNPPASLAHDVTENWPAVVAGWTAVVGPNVQLVTTVDATAAAPVKLLVRVRDGKGKVVGLVRVPSADAGEPVAPVAAGPLKTKRPRG